MVGAGQEGIELQLAVVDGHRFIVRPGSSLIKIAVAAAAISARGGS